MRTRSILLSALRDVTVRRGRARPMRILELGAGDGSLMLGVAHALAPAWPHVELVLLDRQALVRAETIKRYAAVGWAAKPYQADALDWVAQGSAAIAPEENGSQRWDMIVANLFVHHFEGSQLNALLAGVAARGNCFFACEPRRARLALVGSHLIGAIGANAVTRQDAVLSVRAGFCGNEISTIWQGLDGAWRTREYPAGLFSHCFHAERGHAQ